MNREQIQEDLDNTPKGILDNLSKSKLQTHPDGNWYTSETSYKNKRLVIKMRPNHGAKIHVYFTDSNKIDFTLRFKLISTNKLITKAKYKIDRNELLYKAWDYCDELDKSTEFMIEYMANIANISTDSVLKFIKRNPKDRSL